MDATVQKNKKCWLCKTVIKHEKEGCTYKECSKCGKRSVKFTDIEKVRWSWLSGKTDRVKSSPTVKEKIGTE